MRRIAARSESNGRLSWLVLLLALGLACGDSSPATPVVPRLVAPESTFDFGEVPALNEREVALMLVNAGRAPLKVQSVQVREAGSPFRVVSAPEQVPASGQAEVRLGFKPPDQGTWSATLDLQTDDPTQGPVEVSLRGESRTAAIIEVEPAKLDFGRVPEGTSAVRTLTVRARGNAPLVVESVRLGDGTQGLFELVGSTRTPVVLEVGAEVSIAVRFTPRPNAPPEPEGGLLLLTTTDPRQRETEVLLEGGLNRAPMPVMARVGDRVPGQDVVLDATGSTDPDRDTPLTYTWTLTRRPLGAQASIADAHARTTTLVLDPTVPGEYEVELSVTDAAGAKSLQPAASRIVAVPAQQLLVEMSWNNVLTDVDLHVLRGTQAEPGALPDDCHYANPRPDWGAPGPAEDPELLRDRLTGYGPEVFGYESPATGTYRVAAVLARVNGAIDARSAVAVRVYDRGVLKGEYRRTLTTQGEVWKVADVQWPSGVLTELP